MKNVFRVLLAATGLLVSQAVLAQAPAAAPSGSTGQCNDGTYSTAASKSGACRGHQGIKEWYAPSATKAGGGAAAMPAPAASKAMPASDKSAKAGPTAAGGSSAGGGSTAGGAAPAGATGQCKDGTYSTAASKSGACRGHQGVKDWYADAAAKGTTPAAMPAPSAAGKTPSAAMPAPAPASAARNATGGAAMPAPSASAPPVAGKAASSQAMAPASASAQPGAMTQASGGGPGSVWVNTATKVYHCSGTRFYGKTKEGKYMAEADAKAMGAHPDHGTPCSK